VVLGDGLPEGSKDLAGARAQVRDGIAAILPHARAAGVPLAIEPLHPMYALERCCVSTLCQANDLCDALAPDDPMLGVAVDVYHVHWDPQLEQEIARARARILAFHVCDWLAPTKHMLLDRGMMGDGLIDIPYIRGLVEATGYDGPIEVEIFSRDDWWRREPDEVLRIVTERYQSVV
jgi:sugar phosphate isomerase/epimerase